jgi:PilZ domain-containing protein
LFAFQLISPAKFLAVTSCLVTGAFSIRRTLRAAYDFMLSDRRRQFRCPTILPVRLKLVRSGAAFECSTVNISAKGVAIYSSRRLKPTESLDLEIVLPDGFVVLASGLVVWDDGLGRAA